MKSTSYDASVFATIHSANEDKSGPGQSIKMILKRLWNLHGLVVLRNGRLVLEQYFRSLRRWLEERLLGKAGSNVVHVPSFLARCARLERDKREAQRPELERRVWGALTVRARRFSTLNFVDFTRREGHVFQAWEESSVRIA